jgi:PUA domain protein
MFKQKFEEPLNSHPLKQSANKAVRSKIVETYPSIEPYIDELWPKKAQVLQLKLKG